MTNETAQQRRARRWRMIDYYGNQENEMARLADFCREGGWVWKFLKMLERNARNMRLEIKRLNDSDEEGK